VDFYLQSAFETVYAVIALPEAPSDGERWRIATRHVVTLWGLVFRVQFWEVEVIWVHTMDRGCDMCMSPSTRCVLHHMKIRLVLAVRKLKVRFFLVV
jgi:hypothetical protein